MNKDSNNQPVVGQRDKEDLLAETEKPVRRNRRFIERRLEILRSASAAFNRNGFTGATMEEIAEKAEMAKGNLYYYFSSKQDLLYFCQDYSLSQLIKEANKIEKTNGSADEKLKALISLHVKTVLEVLPGSTAHTDFRSLPKDKLKVIVRKRDRYERAYRTIVKAGIKEGIFKKTDTNVAVWAILGALNWIVQWYSPKGKTSATQIAADFSDLFIKGLISDKHSF